MPPSRPMRRMAPQPDGSGVPLHVDVAVDEPAEQALDGQQPDGAALLVACHERVEALERRAQQQPVHEVGDVVVEPRGEGGRRRASGRPVRQPGLGGGGLGRPPRAAARRRPPRRRRRRRPPTRGAAATSARRRRRRRRRRRPPAMISFTMARIHATHLLGKQVATHTVVATPHTSPPPHHPPSRPRQAPPPSTILLGVLALHGLGARLASSGQPGLTRPSSSTTCSQCRALRSIALKSHLPFSLRLRDLCLLTLMDHLRRHDDVPASR